MEVMACLSWKEGVQGPFFGSNLLMEVGCWINGPSFWRDEDTGVPKGHEALGV